MSTRKFIRKMLKVKAEHIGVKPSKYVKETFDRYQIKKYGRIRRLINQAKGTHPLKNWHMRIANVI